MAGLNDDAAAVAAVTTVRASARNVNFSAETAAAVSAVTRLTIQEYSIRKHRTSFIVKPKNISRHPRRLQNRDRLPSESYLPADSALAGVPGLALKLALH
jgi:hypothetical protein